MKKIYSVGYLLLLVMAMGLTGCSWYNSGDKSAQNNNNKSAMINTKLGLTYLEQGQTNRAKLKLTKALEQAPDKPEVNDAMAYFLEKTGENKAAARYYQIAIKNAPGKGVPLNNYGTFLCRTGDYKKAEYYFLEAVKDPNYLHSSGAYENAGLCALKVGNMQKADNYFKTALKRDAKRPTSLYELARIASFRQQYRLAEGYLDRYLKLAKPNRNVAALGYDIATKLGEWDKAASYGLLLRSKFASPNTQASRETNPS